MIQCLCFLLDFFFGLNVAAFQVISFGCPLSSAGCFAIQPCLELRICTLTWWCLKSSFCRYPSSNNTGWLCFCFLNCGGIVNTTNLLLESQSVHRCTLACVLVIDYMPIDWHVINLCSGSNDCCCAYEIEWGYSNDGPQPYPASIGCEIACKDAQMIITGNFFSNT